MPSFLSKILSAIQSPTDLWRAAKLGNVTAIRRIISDGSDVNAKKHTLNVEGSTPLHFAAHHDHTESVRVLVELGAKINAKDDHGSTPLMEACANGAGEDTIAALIELGANLDAQDKYGFTALSWAASHGREAAVALLLARGANPNQGTKGKQSEVLTKAIEGKNPRVLEMLLAAGAKPGSSGDVSPAIHTAAIYGLHDYVDRLIRAGADPNTTDDSGFPAIMTGVRGKNLKVIQTLISAGADVNAKDSADKTALDIAYEIRRKDLIAELEKAGARRGSENTDEASGSDREGETCSCKPEFAKRGQARSFLTGIETLKQASGYSAQPWNQISGGFFMPLRETRATEDLIKRFHGTCFAWGVYLFRTDDGVGLLPTDDKYEIILAVQTNGQNHDLLPADIVAKMQELERNHPFHLTGAGVAFLEGEFTQRIEHPHELAEWLYEFCPDIVNQGVGGVEGLAKTLSDTRKFFLWWD